MHDSPVSPNEALRRFDPDAYRLAHGTPEDKLEFCRDLASSFGESVGQLRDTLDDLAVTALEALDDMASLDDVKAGLDQFVDGTGTMTLILGEVVLTAADGA